MAPRRAYAIWLALLFNVATVRATMFWTFTSRFAESVSYDPYTYYDGEVTNMDYTYTRTVSADVTPPSSVTPYSTSTYARSYADIEVVYAYYTTSLFVESDLEPYYLTMTEDTSTQTGPSTSTRYVMNVTLTAPSSCSSSFEFTTTTNVYIPSEVTPIITPMSTVAATPSTGYYSVYYEETWYLSNGAAPYSSESDLYWTGYVSQCTAPAARSTGGSRSGGGSSSGGYSYCSVYSGCTSWKVWVIIIASIIPALFLLGVLESWFWFRRLMLGKKALRFGTVCWVLISLWVLCFTRIQNARTFEDQKLLREKWRAMKAGQKFKLWLKWGFRHSYPVEHLGQYSPNTVGIVPAGQPLHPQMAQAPPGFQPFPPGAPPPPGFVLQGAPGQVYYPPPQGWVPAQPGQYPTPPQGYAYAPPPGAAGYYEQTKDGSMVSVSPAPMPPPQPSVSPPAGYGFAPPPASGAPVSPQSPVNAAQMPAPQQPAEAPANPSAPQVPVPTHPPTATQPSHNPNDAPELRR